MHMFSIINFIVKKYDINLIIYFKIINIYIYIYIYIFSVQFLCI